MPTPTRPGQPLDSTSDKETAVNESAQLIAGTAEAFCPSRVAAVIALCAGVEPALVHAIFTLAHAFHRQKHQAPPPAPGA